MTMQTYIALAFEEDGTWAIIVPDIPGCCAEADTLDSALAVASRVLAFHIDSSVQDGTAVNLPRTYEQLKEMEADEDWWDFDSAIIVALRPDRQAEAAE